MIYLKIKKRVFNDVYYPYLANDTRTQIFYGGSSSGKSYFLAQRAVLDVCRGRNYLICRNTQGTIKRSVFNEIVKAINFFKLRSQFDINQTNLVITNKLNQKQIIFCGLDDTEKIKSTTPISGVITDIWVEEATETSYESIKQLDKRLRGKSNFKKRIILSFNPVLKTHFIYKEYFKNWDESKNFYKDENLLILKTTYKDNKFLEEDDKKALEDEVDSYYRDVYTLGNWGIIGATIYKKWETQNLKWLDDAIQSKCGLDFGFADSPSAFLQTHYDKNRKIIYIYRELYARECDNEELSSSILKLINSNVVVYCDNAEPKSIQELKKNKVYALPAKKGKDSVDFGIKWIQKHKIIIDSSCQNFINEISQYQWKKVGNDIVKIPVKKNDHLMDALRYAYSHDMNEEESIIFA